MKERFLQQMSRVYLWHCVPARWGFWEGQSKTDNNSLDCMDFYSNTATPSQAKNQSIPIQTGLMQVDLQIYLSKTSFWLANLQISLNKPVYMGFDWFLAWLGFADVAIKVNAIKGIIVSLWLTFSEAPLGWHSVPKVHSACLHLQPLWHLLSVLL